MVAGIFWPSLVLVDAVLKQIMSHNVLYNRLLSDFPSDWKELKQSDVLSM